MSTVIGEKAWSCGTHSYRDLRVQCGGDKDRTKLWFLKVLLILLFDYVYAVLLSSLYTVSFKMKNNINIAKL